MSEEKCSKCGQPIPGWRAVAFPQTGHRGRPRKLYVGWDSTYPDMTVLVHHADQAVLFESRETALAAAKQFNHGPGRYEAEHVRGET